MLLSSLRKWTRCSERVHERLYANKTKLLLFNQTDRLISLSDVCIPHSILQYHFLELTRRFEQSLSIPSSLMRRDYCVKLLIKIRYWSLLPIIPLGLRYQHQHGCRLALCSSRSQAVAPLTFTELPVHQSASNLKNSVIWGRRETDMTQDFHPLPSSCDPLVLQL